MYLSNTIKLRLFTDVRAFSRNVIYVEGTLNFFWKFKVVYRKHEDDNLHLFVKISWLVKSVYIMLL